ncbi:MAG: YhfC family glutamic-type intramembrane protease [Anaerolineales bacterium]
MNILFVTHALNGLLMIAMPMALALILTRRWKMGWSLWWIGAATFVLSQVGHIPFNWVIGLALERLNTVYWPLIGQQLLNAVFLGLSAGLWEEGARYLVLRFWAKKARSWQAGVLFGAGHGGAEAILLGLLVLVTYASMLVVRSLDLSAVVPAARLQLAQQQVTAYWSMPWYDSLLGALERVFAMTCQIFMAVLVMQVFLRRNIAWLFAAIGFHALIDATAVLGMHYLGAYWTEALVAVYAAASLILTLRLRRSKPESPVGEMAGDPE